MTVTKKKQSVLLSTEAALRSAVYNTFIETCKQMGISF
ncbi:hypothetical protein M083_3663 [Bacteroides fragilis str. 3986 T(B)9]|nr:hypothetical protein M111_3468 [Bacteroides fragilis str. 3986T(B)10]EXY68710.1 hypothetical protein M083_3663 [Bacteroides fragilis str. 3986 T(B)9]EXY98901.1 hypothetical protein M074_3869 [Bacteroides fragilis str. DS-166]EXZ60549.1 hypothetical protein M116_4608 [Bacteroides fragilis str. 3719 A10]EYA51489.1 hypothetical protein M114_3819 [Bacteroides fragilis str. 3986 N(B)22]EYA55459.1 hypothetical protein M112_3833 [Bacteroides fragilis str. 3986 T(B)13]EYE62892.1 hypothetical prote